MKTVLCIVVTAAVAISTSSNGLACGEKFFVAGRGIRFLPTPSERQAATVLFYTPAPSALARTLAQLKTDAALRKAGYRPTLLGTPDDLSRASTTPWDIVLTGVEDAPLVKRQIPPTSQAHLIAVMNGGTAAQFSQARGQFPSLVKTPSRNQDFLDLLDAEAARVFADHLKGPRGR